MSLTSCNPEQRLVAKSTLCAPHLAHNEAASSGRCSSKARFWPSLAPPSESPSPSPASRSFVNSPSTSPTQQAFASTGRFCSSPSASPCSPSSSSECCLLLQPQTLI